MYFLNQNIEEKLNMYDKSIEEILKRLDILDRRLKVHKTKSLNEEDINEDEKIYLSIAGLSRAASLRDKD